LISREQPPDIREMNHPLPQVVLTHSYRSATKGSTFVARRAGM
jgi:hypothetical protein